MDKNSVFYSCNLYENISDEELVNKSKSGDKHALEFLLEKYKELVNMKVSKYFIIGAEKEDIVQEGMIGLYKAVKSYNNDNQNLEKAINRQVAKINNQINSKVYTGGTTLCFAIVKRDNILVGNIGDSKAVITEDNKMIYATKSQNVPNMLGVPEPFDRFHVDGNRIIKCLGGQIEETPTCTFDQINLRDNKNYKIMLYSDGVADLLGTDKVVEIAANSKDDQIARNLVHHAVNNKASYKKELENLKEKCLRGEITKENYQEISTKLEQFTESEFYDEIQAGEDNTTAISATIRRGR